VDLRRRGNPPTEPGGQLPGSAPAGKLAGELTQTKPRRAPTGRSSPGQGGDRCKERTLEGSKASKRACRPPYPVSPADPRSGRCKRARQRVTRNVLATPGNRRPGLPVQRAFGPAGREVGATGKGAANTSVRAAPLGWSNANPQGSRRPARAGTAPREGKALKGDSRGASGMKQGREASGRHGERRVPQGARACRVRGQNRREGQEP